MYEFMRLSLRFIIPLAITLSVVAYAIAPLIDSFTARWFIRDVEIRSKLIANTMQDSLSSLLNQKNDKRLRQLFAGVIQDERIYALALCGTNNQVIYQTPNYPKSLVCEGGLTRSRVVESSLISLHVASYPVLDGGIKLAQLIIVHDLSFVKKRSLDTRLYIVFFFAILGLLISALTVLIAKISFKNWVSGLRSFLKKESRTILKKGKNISSLAKNIPAPELLPVMKDLRQLIRDLEVERMAKDESRISWSPKSLKEILHRDLAGDEVLIVSNREPYIHVKKNDKIEIQVPASGLVTALEPIMRACSGTWIAHGGGSADREVVDENDHISVPPENPSYRIRRVWLTKEEENGYYYGFANEGLWALCHIAHVRPIFRSQDWAHYVAVNEKFAQTVLEEAKTTDPVVLVQDYHFALLPKMIKDRLPNATVITFWHIPFPNPEVFSICPWREELLEGLLGSSILGFHTRFHCNNFLDTVDRFLESRIDRETSTVSYGGHFTAVNRYPISIEFPVKWLGKQKSIQECRSEIRKRYGLKEDLILGIGVDRLDYTKGILERFRAVERLLELHPKWMEKFSFLQIAAPSRTNIEQYQFFDSEVRALAEKINLRFGTSSYQPIVLKIEHHEPQDVYQCYRASELCFVSSLHDGMNLVAKEFVAAHDDELGVLLLSQFTGAARELPEALIVNPYNVDQCAQALQMALEMPLEEQRSRMRNMRDLIQEFNVYRWAGRMLLDAANLRKRNRLLGVPTATIQPLYKAV